jgi:hypothetical protein
VLPRDLELARLPRDLFCTSAWSSCFTISSLLSIIRSKSAIMLSEEWEPILVCGKAGGVEWYVGALGGFSTGV